jgi:hypothetical protein
MRLVKSESHAPDENNPPRTFYFGRDGEFSKGGGLSHGLLSNYFGPPRSEFLTHSAAEGTVAAVRRKSLKSCRKIDMISKMLWAALYACLLIIPSALAQDPTKVEPKHYQLAFENEYVQVVNIHYGQREKSRSTTIRVAWWWFSPGDISSSPKKVKRKRYTPSPASADAFRHSNTQGKTSEILTTTHAILASSASRATLATLRNTAHPPHGCRERKVNAGIYLGGAETMVTSRGKTSHHRLLSVSATIKFAMVMV